MNRPERNRALPKRWHLPHTRGDEPRQLPLILSTVPHLPHTRGDEPVTKPKIIQTNFYICPTRVGMNRSSARYTTADRAHLPHTRGDELLPTRLLHIVQPATAPHAWG